MRTESRAFKCSRVMLLYGVIVSTITFGYVICDECLYIDPFGKQHYQTCSSGCCGTIHKVDCCDHKYLALIVIGSVVGFFLAVIAVVVVIHCCYRRQHPGEIKIFRVTRNYGTISFPESERPRSIEDSDDSIDNVDIVPKVEIAVTPATPEIQPEGAMGNENRPAGRVEEDVQPYYPDVRPYPDNQPYVPDTDPYNPAGRVEPDVQPYRPEDNQPYQPDVQPYTPDNQPYSPDNQPYRPDNQPYRPDNQPYQPDTQPYQADTQPYQPDTAPYQPDTGPFEPDTEPYQPDSGPYVPDDQPYGGDGGDDQPY